MDQQGQKKKGCAKTGSNRRRVLAYFSRHHDRRNACRREVKEAGRKARANRPGRTPAGEARAMRREALKAQGVQRNLAAAERARIPGDPTLDDQIAGAITEMFGASALEQLKAEKAKAAGQA